MTAEHFEFRSVAKRFGPRSALADASFRLTAGQPIALLGPSGGGKSTILRLLAGLEIPDAGEVLRDGKIASDRRGTRIAPHLRGVAMVFQDLALWPNLTALDNVRLGLSGVPLSNAQRKERAAQALDTCNIASLAKRKPGTLSGGEQQRVALARAIAARPTFLLLDEPFASLDLVTKSALLSELAALAARQLLTVVLVSHDPHEVRQLCRSALVVEGGRIIQAGALNELLDEPKTELLRLLSDRLRG